MVNFGNFFSDFHPRWVKFWLNSPRIKKTSSVQRSCFRELYGHWQRFWRQIWILVSLLDSCYMRSMTDVCSMFENWTRTGAAQRGGLKIGFTLGGGWNSATQRCGCAWVCVCDELWPLLCSSWKCRRSNWFLIGTCMINTEILFFFQNSNDDDDDCLTCICIINLRHQTGPEAWNRGISCLIPLIIGSNLWYTRAVSIFWSIRNFAFSPQAARVRGNWEEGTMTMGNFRAISQSSAP